MPDTSRNTPNNQKKRSLEITPPQTDQNITPDRPTTSGNRRKSKRIQKQVQNEPNSQPPSHNLHKSNKASGNKSTENNSPEPLIDLTTENKSNQQTHNVEENDPLTSPELTFFDTLSDPTEPTPKRGQTIIEKIPFSWEELISEERQTNKDNPTTMGTEDEEQRNKSSTNVFVPLRHSTPNTIQADKELTEKEISMVIDMINKTANKNLSNAMRSAIQTAFENAKSVMNCALQEMAKAKLETVSKERNYLQTEVKHLNERVAAEQRHSEQLIHVKQTQTLNNQPKEWTNVVSQMSNTERPFIQQQKQEHIIIVKHKNENNALPIEETVNSTLR